MQSTIAVPLNETPRTYVSRINSWQRYVNVLLARELSRMVRYFDAVYQWLPRREDGRGVIANIDTPYKEVIEDGAALPDLSAEETRRTAILVNGTFNHHFDIQGLLKELRPKLSRTSRLMVILYNPYLRWLYAIANKLGLRSGDLPSTFITGVDLQNLAKISGFEIVHQQYVAYVPWRMLGLGTLINKILPMIPVMRWFALTVVATLRPVIASERVGLSVVIPARNEKGNIENALLRMPDLGCPIEVIFVEGHSSDGTWEEIQRVAKAYSNRFRIQKLQQSGKGKADAVRLGFAHATQPLLTILDADLTMPPEMLGRFYEAYCEGRADFVNGSRLVYPMEGDAMRFLNRLGNIFFAKSLSWVLGTRLGDSLCGTKLLAKHDYDRFIAWRSDFGDFDPFGDFELLFPAATMGLGTVDIPVRYLARQYGSTNISRFRHGFQLLKMTSTGFFRIKLGLTRHASNR
jgi:hypothetical protein